MFLDDKCGIYSVTPGCCVLVVYFFFSSRRRHTIFDCDWSSDVCSSDLGITGPSTASPYLRNLQFDVEALSAPDARMEWPRSEERRVGKECRSRWSPYH